MTNGIKVVWRVNRNIDEVEYFCGIDVDHLATIPPISSVRATWPRYKGGISFAYRVDTRCERTHDGMVHLMVVYRPEQNSALAAAADYDIIWGTNTIILQEGTRTGRCNWVPDDPSPDVFEGWSVHWEAFDLGESHERTHAKYWRSRRDLQFRGVILDCDGGCCTLTGETTVHALEAAHLIPAKNGDNDMPFNGITLRADLHRMFDAGLFTFGENGEVVFPDMSKKLSTEYRQLLEGKALPESTLARVRSTLAHAQFRERLCSSYRVDDRQSKAC